MDDPETYGDTFHQLSFKQAMECQPPILCDYNIITIGVSRDEVRDLITRNAFVRPMGGKWNEEMEADMLAAMIALRKAMKDYPIKHAVSFHSSIQRAELFKDHNETFSREFPEFGQLDTFHVSGQTPTGTRTNIIKSFAQAERSLVTNARCLTEGVDVPGIDCVLFADPRRSTVDIVQAVGRALRPSEGKKLGYVILPILHDMDVSSNEILESEAFNEVLKTITSLATNDDRIIEYFRLTSEGKRPGNSKRIEFRLNELAAQNVDIRSVIKDIEIRCWQRVAKLAWMPFLEARDRVRSLKLRNINQWRDYAARGLDNIPVRPDFVYKNTGWVNWGDWLGTMYLSAKDRNWRNFADARSYVRKLGLKSQSEWNKYLRGQIPGVGAKPSDIPSAPMRTYRHSGWSGWSDWLGSKNIAPGMHVWRSFAEARQFARSLSIKNLSEWRRYCAGKLATQLAKPTDIPTNPAVVYKDAGWINWGDWFGTHFVALYKRNYRDFTDARAFSQSLGLKSKEDWQEYSKGKPGELAAKPDDIPTNPARVYKDTGWNGWGDWLGTGYVAHQNRKFLRFLEARQFVHELKLQNVSSWNKYRVGKLPGMPPKPPNIPSCPDITYKSEWLGWGDWLGTGSVAPSKMKWLPFESARDFARKIKLQNQPEWSKYCKGERKDLPDRPADVPADPASVYKGKGWDGYKDWLGATTIKAGDRFRNFDQARAFARSLKFKSHSEWRLYVAGKINGLALKPADIPSDPYSAYRALGWVSWPDWLGTKM
jgi:hypothetical protein